MKMKMLMMMTCCYIVVVGVDDDDAVPLQMNVLLLGGVSAEIVGARRQILEKIGLSITCSFWHFNFHMSDFFL